MILSVLCFISSVFLHVSIKLMDMDQTEQYHWKPWGGRVAVTTRYVALVRHEEEIIMVELFEERSYELFRNFKHIVFVFYARGTLSISRHVWFWVCWCHKRLTLRCPLVDVLVNIHANVKEAWKYVSSDGNIVWNGRMHFRTSVEHKWAFRVCKPQLSTYRETDHFKSVKKLFSLK